MKRKTELWGSLLLAFAVLEVINFREMQLLDYAIAAVAGAYGTVLLVKGIRRMRQ